MLEFTTGGKVEKNPSHIFEEDLMPPRKRISLKEALVALCGISLLLGIGVLISNAKSIEELIEGFVFLRIKGFLKLQWLTEIPNEYIVVLIIIGVIIYNLIK